MADPFDATNSDAPPDPNAFLGVSPDAWRNLMTFGAATTAAANARDGRGFLTYGTGPLGALGAGVLAATNSATTNAQARSDMARAAATKGYLQSQTQSQNLQNQLLQTQMPFAKAKAGLQMQMLNNMTGGVPAMPQTMPGGAPSVGPQSSAAPAGGDPNAFAQQWMPQAQRVASQLGVAPATVLGHWGQETGWGANLQGNNVGNITAGSGWQGPTIARGDTNGSGTPITQSFRAYSSPDQAADDYASLVQNRYPAAVGAPNALSYGQALQSGGYMANPNGPQAIAAAAGRVAGAGQQPYQVAANGPVAPPQGAPSAQPSPMTPQSGIGPQGQLPPVLAGIKSQSD